MDNLMTTAVTQPSPQSPAQTRESALYQAYEYGASAATGDFATSLKNFQEKFANDPEARRQFNAGLSAAAREQNSGH